MRDTRAAILAEAEILIRGRGYSGFSYADLADVVGIRKASIHHHFATKTELAAALLDAYDKRYDAALATIEAASADGVQRVGAYGALYLQGVEKGLGCLCAALAAELDSLPDVLRAGLTRFFGKHVAWLEGILDAARANGTVRTAVDPRSYARMVVAALEGALMMERALDGSNGFDLALRAVLDGLRPTPAAD